MSGFQKADLNLVRIENGVQMWGLQQMFLTAQQTQTRFVQDNPGYNAVSSCNSTSNTVIVDVDTVYYIKCMIWKMDSRVFGLLCMTLKLHLLSSSMSHLWKYVKSLSFTAFPSPSQQQMCKSRPIIGRDWGNFLLRAVLKFKTHTALWSAEPELWRHV